MHIRLPVPARLAVALALVSVSLTAQSAVPPTAQGQPPATGAAGAPPSRGQAGEPTFRVAIDLVTTDVIARDDAGQFVADLKKDDFEIYEDGVRQEIATFTLVHGGRVLNQLLPPPPPPQAATNKSTAVATAPRPKRATCPRPVCIF